MMERQEIPITIEAAEAQAAQWQLSGRLRFIVPQSTTTELPKLQQEWVERISGKRQWRKVFVEVVPNDEFFLA